MHIQVELIWIILLDVNMYLLLEYTCGTCMEAMLHVFSAAKLALLHYHYRSSIACIV